VLVPLLHVLCRPELLAVAQQELPPLAPVIFVHVRQRQGLSGVCHGNQVPVFLQQELHHLWCWRVLRLCVSRVSLQRNQ
jgi:hypothetical protein